MDDVEAARAWARPGALRSPSETTVDLLGLEGVTTWAFPRARGSVGTSTVGERIECEITAADPRTDDEFPATPVRFDIDVPASTPNLDRVDGKTYVVRFDLPDLIGSFSRKSTTGTPHYEYRAAKSAQWIEAGSYTIRYEKLRRN